MDTEFTTPDAEFIARVERARKMTPMEKLLGGFRLFEEEQKQLAAKFRLEFPNEDDAQIDQRVSDHYREIRDQEHREWMELVNRGIVLLP
jgi:hypothetical protein